MSQVSRKIPFWNGLRQDYLVPKSDTPAPWIRDHELDRPQRKCSRCGVSFQPTVKRRMLCLQCFKWAKDSA
ncbi:hypothetical protein LA6_001167 [Marinibacterium anthonyi]|nr:hypothetical protein LA6_001167 [Marinibacterium anthonyi]